MQESTDGSFAARLDRGLEAGPPSACNGVRRTSSGWRCGSTWAPTRPAPGPVDRCAAPCRVGRDRRCRSGRESPSLRPGNRCYVADELLLDTGALVSILDRSQSGHGAFAAFFDGWPGPVVTSEAVLTEATHLLGRFSRRGRCLSLRSCCTAARRSCPRRRPLLGRCRALMRRYGDLPMDLADATLVLLAEELRTDLVLTTDRRHFEAYRIAGQRRFRMLPDGQQGQ